MLKKTVVLGTILTGICAASSPAQANYKSGFFAGGHVGASFGSGRFNSNFNPNNPVFPAASASGRGSKTSALFGILGGYRHLFQDGFTVGFDVSGNLYTTNSITKQLNHVINTINFPFTNKLSRRWSITPSVDFGKIFCNRWHVVLGLGLGISGFKQQVSSPFPTSAATTTNSSSLTKLGFVPSIGVEYAATQNVSVVGNISYEMYQKVSKTFGAQLTPGLSTSSYTSSISPNYLSLRVGAIYRF